MTTMTTTEHRFATWRPVLTAIVMLFGLVLTGCELLVSEDESTRVTGVIVANAGNFSDQNGFLTTYDPETGNTGRSQSLNGFVHGLELIDNELFAIINTFSLGRVDILNPETLQTRGQIADLESPRALIRINDTYYIVGFSFGEPGVVVPVDVASRTPSDPIQVGLTPEDIAFAAGRLYVANNGSLGDGTTLSVIDPSGSDAVDTMEIGCDGPRDIYEIGGDELAVVCTGKTVYNEDFSEIIDATPGSVVFVDAERGSVLSEIELPGQAGSTNGSETANYEPDTEELFITLGAVNRIVVVGVAERTIRSTIDVPPESGLIGLSGINYDPDRDVLYVGRLPVSGAGPFPDFTSSGAVVILERSGRVIDSFDVGPAPSSVILNTDE